ncbi:hypothetical protein KEM54_001253 [Ascosphaera aggregata]|nr:hypothetical protein KEM54_001253 [Ascosphaera aggregata]
MDTGWRLTPNVGTRSSSSSWAKSLKRIEEISPEAASQTGKALPLLRRQSFPLKTDLALQEAETLLKTRRNHAFTSKSHLLRRHPSRTAYRQSEICEAMEWLLMSGGSLDLMASLLIKNKEAKPTKQLPILKMSSSSRDVNSLLKSAIQLKKLDMVSLISMYADQWALDSCLKQSLLERDLQCATALLRNGADPVQCGDIFLACARNQDLEVVQLVCRAEKKVSPATLDCALEIAAFQEELEMVVVLLKGGANGDRSGVLTRAVQAGEINIVSALILSNRPPTPMSLDKAVGAALTLETPGLQEALLEVLLCGGATGPGVNKALVTVTQAGNDRLISLLVEYGASVTYNDGEAIAKAIDKGNLHAACILLGGRMNSKTASHILSSLPEIGSYLSTEQKSTLMSRLVECGAYGDALGIALVDVAYKQETELIDYLLDHNASTDYNNAQVLRHAVASESISLLDRLLAKSRPSESSLNSCFPLLGSVSSKALLDITRRLLDAGASGPAVNEALATAVASPFNADKEAIVGEFVYHGTDVNVGNGKCFVHAAAAGDIPILSLLLAGNPSPEALSQGIPEACNLPNAATRFTVLDLLVTAGAQGPLLDQGLVTLVDCTPLDIPLIALLLEKGGANVNADGGNLIAKAASQGNVDLLCILLQYGPSMSSLRNALPAAMSLSDADTQYAICRNLLAAGVTGEPVDDALITIQRSRTSHPALIELFVTCGADINYKDGAAIRTAIEYRDEKQLTLLLSSPKTPSSDTLYLALATLLEVRSSRTCEIARMLLDIGRRRSLNYINKILIETVKARREIELIEVLLEYGGNINYRDGLSLRYAIEMQATDIMDLLLKQKITPSTLDTAFQSALTVTRQLRTSYVEKVLAAGYQGRDLDTTLLNIVKESPCDTELVKILLDYGASVHFARHETFSHAATIGDISTLKVLFEKSSDPTTAGLVFNRLVKSSNAWVSDAGFQVLQILLDNGATGTIVSEALDKVIQYSAAVPRPAKFVELLLQYGADPCYGNGHVLWTAVANGDAEVLSPLLSLGKIPLQLFSKTFSKLFSSGLTEEAALSLFNVFLQPPRKLEDITGPEYSSEGSLLEPITFTALKVWPSGTAIVNAILKAGVSTEKTMPFTIDEEEGVEQVSLLLWILLQPPDRVCVELIDMLIENGANVNFQSSRSLQTPLLIAAKDGRPDIVSSLLKGGADVAALDKKGRTPLILATKSANQQTIRLLLDAGAPVDDGSLHEAARELDFVTAETLILQGHNPNFPSLLHYGRTALAELCLYSSVPSSKLSKLHNTIKALVAGQADLKVKTQEKPLILHAMENPYASVDMTRLILSSGLWKNINEDCCLYSKDGFVYSPTMYISKGLCQTTQPQELLRILKASGCKNVYYREDVLGLSKQPSDMVGAPPEIIEETRRLKHRQRLLEEREEDHSITLKHNADFAEQHEGFMSRSHTLRMNQSRELADSSDARAIRSAALVQRIQNEAAANRQLLSKQTHELEKQQYGEKVQLRLDGLKREGKIHGEHQQSTLGNNKLLYKTQLDYQNTAARIQMNLQKALEESEARRKKAQEACSKAQYDMERNIASRREMLIEKHANLMLSGRRLNEGTNQRLLCDGDGVEVD